MFDVFICHASEDKSEAARPIAEGLSASGLSVWYDDFSLRVGDSLHQSIERGLSKSRYGVVIFSRSFFKKKWPQQELNGLFALEIQYGKKILPVWHKVNYKYVLKYSPILADRVAARTSDGIDRVIEKLLGSLDPKMSHKVQERLAVAVTPGRVRFYAAGWSVKTPIRLCNRAESPVYAVWVKLALEGNGVTAESIQVEMGNPTTILQGNLPGRGLPIAVSPDVIRLDAVDQNICETVFLLIHTLGPKASRELLVSSTALVDSATHVSVVSFATEPAELLRQGGQVAMPFTLPEPVKLKRVSGLLRHT